MNIKRARIIGAIAGTLLLALLVWRLLGNDFLYAGTVEATEVDISSRVSSVISALEVKEGDTVRLGAPLVRLACEDIRLSAGLAETNYRRAAELFKSGSMPQAEYDRIRYQREDASVRETWCSITAPLAGVVLDIYHEPGELVGPGTKLMTLADLSEVWTYVYVPQPVLARIKPGMAVLGVLPEVKGRTLPGTVARIREEAEFTPKNVQTREERTRLVYGVKIAFPNRDGLLKPGMTIEVRLPK
ncbi:MAG: efflux RND transporter periplasmic adaptor subunit [Candidatus Coatesbacteria bacterium]